MLSLLTLFEIASVVELIWLFAIHLTWISLTTIRLCCYLIAYHRLELLLDLLLVEIAQEVSEVTLREAISARLCGDRRRLGLTTHWAAGRRRCTWEPRRLLHDVNISVRFLSLHTCLGWAHHGSGATGDDISAVYIEVVVQYPLLVLLIFDHLLTEQAVAVLALLELNQSAHAIQILGVQIFLY